MKNKIWVSIYIVFIVIGIAYLIKSPNPPVGGILVAFALYKLIPLLIKRSKREVK